MQKRLVGISMVKNEADIIEASVRHNLGYLDQLIVFDHASSDATPAILAALKAEGLALTVLSARAADPRFAQHEQMTQLARMAFADQRADWVFALDADEFLQCASRAALEDALDHPGDWLWQLRWRTYVAQDGAIDPHPLRRLRWRVETDPRDEGKIVLGRSAVASGEWFIGPGNHWLIRKERDQFVAVKGMPVPEVHLAHLPLRSPQQLIAKALIGWLSARMVYGTGKETSPFAWHWRDLYQRILQGETMDDAEVRNYAIDIYALNRSPGSDEASATYSLVEDVWLDPPALKYTPPDAIDPARLLAAWSSLLVDRALPLLRRN